MKFGTREWATVNKNFLLGCGHNCRYCYARWNALKRFKQINNADDWITPCFNEKKFNEIPKKVDGRIMFPTQHDILPEYIHQTINYLGRWLAVGNDILIVSKPHFSCVKKLCTSLQEYRKQIVYRFTIGSIYNATLEFWEPNAPSYEERLASLVYAYEHGFQTSVSIEPMLDATVSAIIDDCRDYVSDTIWVGKVNHPAMRIERNNWAPNDYMFWVEMNKTTRDDFIRTLYFKHKDEKKIRWKESIKKVMNLPDGEIG